MRRWLLPLLLTGEMSLFLLLGAPEMRTSSDLVRYLQGYFSDLMAQAAPNLLLAFGMTLVLMTAGIDLSVGSQVALVACVMSSFAGGAGFWWKAIPAGLAAGLGLGLFNGVLIALMQVPPIIATLGTMIFYRGLCYVVMGELEKSPFIEVPGYEWFGHLAGGMTVVALLYFVVGEYVRRTRWHREILMLGGNPIAARYAGIPVSRRVVEVYCGSGLLAYLAAVCFTARNSSVSASSLTGLELPIIVAVILGGTRVEGGAGSWWGSFWGVLLIAVLEEGLRGATVWGDQYFPFKTSHLEFILLGLLLVVGVWLSHRFTRSE